MREFISTKRDEKKLWRRVRRKYKRYLYWNVITIICVIIMLLISRWVIVGGEQGINFDVLVLCVGVNFIPFIITCICRAIAISGGSEVLLNRVYNKVVVSDSYFKLEYKPSLKMQEVEGYFVEDIMDFSSINKIENNVDKGYVEIYGFHEIRRSFVSNGTYFSDKSFSKNSSEGSIRLYSSYKNFEDCIRLISLRSGVIVKKM